MSLDILYLKNDTTAQIGKFISYQTGWSPTSPEDPPVPQSEIDAYLLEQAKIDKIKTLKSDLETFSDAGFLYSGNTFDLTDQGALNLGVKRGTSSGSAYKFTFCDINNVRIDFGNQSVFDTFSESLSDERDRIMNVYIDYKAQISACTDVAAVDASVIDFNA